MLRVEVADDAEEVASVGAVRQGAALLLALEDGDGVEAIASDGVAEVALGVFETEPLEGALEASSHEGVEAGSAGLPGSLLLSQARSQALLGLAPLLLADGLGVELRAALAATVTAGPMVEGASEDEGDEVGDLVSEPSRLVRIEDELAPRKAAR